MSTAQNTKRHTYQDYLQWNNDTRVELIDGIVFDMSPAPIIPHQLLVGNIHQKFKTHLQGHRYIPLSAPTDVVLSDYDVVQPDVFVVCDHSKVYKSHIKGAPDLIIEVLSPYTNKKDRWDKKNLYEKYGVKEYILIDPEAKFAERYTLQPSGKFHRGDVFNQDQEISLTSLESLTLPLQEIFDLPIQFED